MIRLLLRQAKVSKFYAPNRMFLGGILKNVKDLVVKKKQEHEDAKRVSGMIDEMMKGTGVMGALMKPIIKKFASMAAGKALESMREAEDIFESLLFIIQSNKQLKQIFGENIRLLAVKDLNSRLFDHSEATVYCKLVIEGDKDMGEIEVQAHRDVNHKLEISLVQGTSQSGRNFVIMIDPKQTEKRKTQQIIDVKAK